MQMCPSEKPDWTSSTASVQYEWGSQPTLSHSLSMINISNQTIPHRIIRSSFENYALLWVLSKVWLGHLRLLVWHFVFFSKCSEQVNRINMLHGFCFLFNQYILSIFLHNISKRGWEPESHSQVTLSAWMWSTLMGILSPKTVPPPKQLECLHVNRRINSKYIKWLICLVAVFAELNHGTCLIKLSCLSLLFLSFYWRLCFQTAHRGFQIGVIIKRKWKKLFSLVYSDCFVSTYLDLIYWVGLCKNNFGL